RAPCGRRQPADARTAARVRRCRGSRVRSRLDPDASATGSRRSRSDRRDRGARAACRADLDPAPEPRRRVPATHRRPARRSRLNTKGASAMNTITEAATLALPRPRRPSHAQALRTLAGRRFALTARTPRELLVPLLTPVLFALVIAPALKTALHTSPGYEAYVAIGTVGLLVPLNTFFLGLGVIVAPQTR